ncbi:MAG: hypothetical protein EB027_05100, partial [Actinobacteria bacterium]|nr:hypothetical protein [Actinomycetota bacterium]
MTDDLLDSAVDLLNVCAERVWHRRDRKHLPGNVKQRTEFAQRTDDIDSLLPQRRECEVAQAVTYAHSLPPGMEPVLHVNAFFDPPNLTWSNGAQACEVEIDPATGVTRLLSYIVVDDIGTVINPMVVEGQVHGAIAQGIGQAMFESAVYDRETGQLYTGSFMDYTMPRADVLPAFVSETDESQPCTHNPSRYDLPEPNPRARCGISTASLAEDPIRTGETRQAHRATATRLDPPRHPAHPHPSP